MRGDVLGKKVPSKREYIRKIYFSFTFSAHTWWFILNSNVSENNMHSVERLSAIKPYLPFRLRGLSRRLLNWFPLHQKISVRVGANFQALCIISWQHNQYSTDFLSITIIKAASHEIPYLHLSLSYFDKCHLQCKQCSFVCFWNGISCTIGFIRFSTGNLLSNKLYSLTCNLVLSGSDSWNQFFFFLVIQFVCFTVRRVSYWFVVSKIYIALKMLLQCILHAAWCDINASLIGLSLSMSL